MRKIILLVISLVSMNCLFAQDNDTVLKPKGKLFVKIFTNYHSTFTEDKTHNAFEIQRAYFGYDYKISKDFSGKVCLDFGNPDDDGKFMMTAYLKNAYFQYKYDKLKLKFGLIGRSQFSIQEKFWGGRYMDKSFMDKNKFGSSADIGLSASYKINDFISIDAGIDNGDGYKSVELDSIFMYSGGLTISPLNSLNIRFYTDYTKDKETQQTFAGFVGYSVNGFSIGAEYNYQINNKIKIDHDLSGFSAYVSYKAGKIRGFARYDKLESATIDNEENGWNYEKDGQFILAGVEFSPVKNIKIAPNYQVWSSDSDAHVKHSVYLSCEIKF